MLVIPRSIKIKWFVLWYNIRVNVQRSREFVRKELGRYRQFFKQNETGFSYLFFAQTSFIALNVFWRYQSRLLFGEFPAHSLLGGLAIINVVASYFLPLLFVIGAFFSFNYPKGKDERNFFIFIILVLFLIIFSTTLMNWLILYFICAL